MAFDRMALRDRIRRYADGDFVAVCGIPALKETGVLPADLAAADDDLDLARLCGLLLWCRSMEADDADEHADLVPALALLQPRLARRPVAVAPAIAEYFAEFGSGPLTAADAWHGPALALAHSRESRDTAVASIVVALLRRRRHRRHGSGRGSGIEQPGDGGPVRVVGRPRRPGRGA